MKYKILSFDMFQTLVDVNQRIPYIWRDIYRAQYTDELALESAKAIIKTYKSVYKQAISSTKFITMHDLYTECAHIALREGAYKVSARDVVTKLIRQHALAPFYEDTLECLSVYGKNHVLILSSDSCHEMVDGILEKLAFQHTFISDDLLCYKADLQGRFFDSILQQTGVLPKDILHIGDSEADIWGAQRSGIEACLICRDGKRPGGIDPDYTITSLHQLKDILQD